MENTGPGFEKALESEIERHFDLPRIRRVPAGQPFTWLAQGCRDLRGNLVESLAYGTIVTAIGWAIWTYTAGRPQPFTASITGFFLLAPLLAAGLYEISRRHELGTRHRLRRIAAGLAAQRRRARGIRTRARDRRDLLGAALGDPVRAVLPAATVPNLEAFYRDLFLSGDYLAAHRRLRRDRRRARDRGLRALGDLDSDAARPRRRHLHRDGDQPRRGRPQHSGDGGLGDADRRPHRDRFRDVDDRDDPDLSRAGSRDLACVPGPDPDT